MQQNGKFHFYDFVLSDGIKQANPNQLHPEAAAEAAAQKADATFCGMT